MLRGQMETTKLSSKGQVIIPKTVRESRGWEPGTELVVEERPDGVLLRMRSIFTPTRLEDVAGSIPYGGPSKTLREMDDAIAAEVRRRAARLKER